MGKTLDYCGTFLKQTDPERFFLSLLAPAQVQPDLWAVLAFNQEIAKTREVVTDTTIGLIRLQWWRDALQKIYAGEGALKHEVVTPLAGAIARHGLPLELFEALIYAREFDVEDRAPSSLDGFVNYADFTNTPLLQLCLKITGRDEECREVGIAYGMTGLLRAAVFHAHQHRCYIPEDMLAEAGMTTAHMFDLKLSPQFPDVIRVLAHEATEHAERIKPRSPFLKGLQKVTRLQLREMHKNHYNVLDPSWINPPPFWQLKVAWAANF